MRHFLILFLFFISQIAMAIDFGISIDEDGGLVDIDGSVVGHVSDLPSGVGAPDTENNGGVGSGEYGGYGESVDGLFGGGAGNENQGQSTISSVLDTVVEKAKESTLGLVAVSVVEGIVGFVAVVDEKTSVTQEALAAGFSQGRTTTDPSMYPGAFYSAANESQSSNGVKPGSGVVPYGVLDSIARSTRTTLEKEMSKEARAIDDAINSGKIGVAYSGANLSQVVDVSQLSTHEQFGLQNSVVAIGTTRDLADVFGKEAIAGRQGFHSFGLSTITGGMINGGIIGISTDATPESETLGVISHEAVHAADLAAGTQALAAIQSGTLNEKEEAIAMDTVNAMMASLAPDQNQMTEIPEIAEQLEVVAPSMLEDQDHYSSTLAEVRAISGSSVSSKNDLSAHIAHEYGLTESVADDVAGILSESQVAQEVDAAYDSFHESGLGERNF